jgi:hypothetical protein
MTHEQKMALCKEINEALNGEAARETAYQGPLTPVGSNATQGQRDAYTRALLTRDAGQLTAPERQFLAGQITDALRLCGF